MNLADNLLAQIRSGAITIGEALESLPESLRRSVMSNIKSGALSPYEALEGATSEFNKLGPKAGPQSMQGPPNPSQFIGPPSPNQAYGPFQPGQGFNAPQGPNLPQSTVGSSGTPKMPLPQGGNVSFNPMQIFSLLRGNPYIAGVSKALESKPLNVGEEALLQQIRERASGVTAATQPQLPPAQTQERIYNYKNNYPGREPNQEAWEKSRQPSGINYPGREPDQAAWEKAQSAPNTPSVAPRVPSMRSPAASAPVAQTSNNVYYLDRGDGSPVMPMGPQLPKGMSAGAQPGGGYIFGLNTPAPTNAVARGMQRGLGIKQPEQTTGPVDPLTRKAYAPVSAPKAEEPAKNMDYGDRTPPLARPKEFNAPEERRGGSIHGPTMAAGGVPCHSGIINMAVGGRTDHIPMNVMEGSYVLPADIVSGLGEGNTMAGSKILDQMMKTGPAGVKLPSFRANPRFPSPMYTPPKQNPYEPPKTAARGGSMAGSRPVPIVAAGGEYVVPPSVVTALGQGDINKGHEYLDNFVKYVRGHLVKTLSKLPGPRKD